MSHDADACPYRRSLMAILRVIQDEVAEAGTPGDVECGDDLTALFQLVLMGGDMAAAFESLYREEKPG